MKILLVDDSKLQRLAIQRILAKAGHEVALAADGEEGLRLARQSLPNLILLDMILPRMDGIAVLEALKKDSSTAHIPVIVLTGLSQRNEEKLKGAGAAAFYQKSELGIEKGSDALLAIVHRVLAETPKVPSTGIRTATN
jgi:twitching motility two-component system response regulator PilH